MSRLHLSFLATALLLGACQTSQRHAPSASSGSGRYPTEREKWAWVEQRKLKEAGPHEITAARAAEAHFVGQRAMSADGRLCVVFHMGKLLRTDGQNTTTSYYSVETQSGKVLAQIESTLSAELNEELGYKQKVWFTRNGQVMIWETWCDGAASHDTTALVSLFSGSTQCVVRYLTLPTFTGYPGIEEHGAVPVGILGDAMLFDPLVSGKIYKIPLRSIHGAASPLPFTTG